MYHYTMIQWLFFFYFYCFFGWCFESAVVSLKQKKLVNRGFMRGPFLPLYGSGAIMMLVVSMPFQDNIVMVYLAGCVGATVLEYLTGVTMEALFKVRYWDYSHKKFNFQGHICLTSTLAWGFLTILMTGYVHKYVEAAAGHVPYRYLLIATYILTAFLCGDFALSFKAALDLREVLAGMEKARQELLRVQKRLDVLVAVGKDELKERVNQSKDSLLEKRDALLEKKDALWEKKDALFEKKDQLFEKKGAFFEKREEKSETKEPSVEKKERILSGISMPEMNMEELKASIEEKLESMRKILSERPHMFGDKEKSEMADLVKKYHRNVEKRESYGRLKDFFQRDLIRSNPTMSSRKFSDALEELKKRWP